MADKKTTKPKKKASPVKKVSKPSATKKVASEGPTLKLSKEERNWGMFCHLGALAGFVIPFGNIVVPLILWLVKREDSPFINVQGKESLNFQISMTLYFLISVLLIFVFIGIIILPILAFINIILVIVASIKAQDGGVYNYPLSIKFV